MAKGKNAKKISAKNNGSIKRNAGSKKAAWIAGVAAICVVAIIIAAVVINNRSNSSHLGDGEYYADIVIRDYGTITIKLEPDAAPETVANFIDLADSGFYDGLTFHRIIEGFMMQGGAPADSGSGSAIKTIKGEFSANGVENNLSHVRGTVSMARSSDYDSASSQFFIVHEDSTFLDGQYAAFGTVTEGMDIVDSICESANPTDDNGTIPADEQPVIETITIRENAA